MIRLAHVADLHCCREHQEAAMKSLQTLADSIKKAPVDLVAIAGDTWDASMLNTEASGFNGFIDAIRNIADEAPVAMIYGTPSHDTDGSLEVFRKISSKHPITILDPAQSYLLAGDGEDAEIVPDDGGVHPSARAVILGVPEPRKKYLLANATAGKDELEAALRVWRAGEGYSHVFLRHAEIDAVSDAFFALRQGLRAGDGIELGAAYDQLRYHLDCIASMEHVSPGSVF